MLTAAQIVTKACGLAKAPGFTSQGGQDLNLTLNDLVLHRDLKINRKETTIAVTAASNGPFTLATDYLRTYDLFYTINNMPYFLFPMSQEQFDALFKDPSVANYPMWYATDLTNQATQAACTIRIWPQSTTALTLTHRYMINRADISSPESSSTVPWFPDQDYLIHATATRLMKLTDDGRYDKFVVDGENMLRTHLIMEGDEQQVVKEVRLDPQRFRINRGIKNTKVQPF